MISAKIRFATAPLFALSLLTGFAHRRAAASLLSPVVGKTGGPRRVCVRMEPRGGFEASPSRAAAKRRSCRTERTPSSEEALLLLLPVVGGEVDLPHHGPLHLLPLLDLPGRAEVAVLAARPVGAAV